jgi:hypothetical protein
MGRQGHQTRNRCSARYGEGVWQDMLPSIAASPPFLIAGSVARYNVCREGWDGEPECMLAAHMLEKHATRSGGLAAAGRFRIANSEAVRLVRAHWAEITAEGPFRRGRQSSRSATTAHRPGATTLPTGTCQTQTS